TFAFGSTDMGNVSQLVPAIHPTVAVAPSDVVIHTPQFMEAAASETGNRGILDGAKALAMTVLDLLANPKMVTKAKEEFVRQK
ncbi:MAG: M20 family peptidase, partial [Chloroflexi bacterium]|nr:M20 family peptidase [Chloroflexota bacterium]